MIWQLEWPHSGTVIQCSFCTYVRIQVFVEVMVCLYSAGTYYNTAKINEVCFNSLTSTAKNLTSITKAPTYSHGQRDSQHRNREIAGEEVKCITNQREGIYPDGIYPDGIYPDGIYPDDIKCRAVRLHELDTVMVQKCMYCNINI